MMSYGEQDICQVKPQRMSQGGREGLYKFERGGEDITNAWGGV